MDFLSTILSGAAQQVGAFNLTLLQEEASHGAEEHGTAAGNLAEQLSGHVAEVSETLNQSEAIQQASGGILKPIFEMAQFMEFESFYWVAFALMVAGVVCFVGQLVFAKFFLLFKGSLNVREIISDFFCLIVSLVGLVLTTQAASNFSTFTESSTGVLSATAVGALLGFVLYWWGQRTEFDAARRIPKQESV